MTLPLRPLIKLTGLNLVSQRYSDRLIGLTTSENGTTYSFTVLNNSNYKAADSVNIQGVVGLPDPSTLTIDSLVDSDTIVFTGQSPLEYPIGYLESFRITSVGTYYYLRVYLESGSTININSTVTFSGITGTFSPLNAQELTVYSANSYSLLFRTMSGTPFGISSTYFPEIRATPTAPNIFPNPLPIATNVAADAALLLKNSNGEINASQLAATVALVPPNYSSSEYLTDYNRSEMQVGHIEIEESARTVDGSLRYHHNATKRKFTVSWHNLPADREAIADIDGGLAANEILQVYKNNKGTFYLEIYNRDSSRKTSAGPDLKTLVRFADGGCDYGITKRNYLVNSTQKLTDLWNISLSLEEV